MGRRKMTEGGFVLLGSTALGLQFLWELKL